MIGLLELLSYGATGLSLAASGLSFVYFVIAFVRVYQVSFWDATKRLALLGLLLLHGFGLLVFVGVLITAFWVARAMV